MELTKKQIKILQQYTMYLMDLAKLVDSTNSTMVRNRAQKAFDSRYDSLIGYMHRIGVYQHYIDLYSNHKDFCVFETVNDLVMQHKVKQLYKELNLTVME